ncbi:chloride channel protein [Achromobacter insolitus]|uniref:Voltage-gated ClC-type chloride channel ClcB n=3 Tax=Achromobacter insolitus TaxID=217204 RepID=A0A6S7EV87_9BURK|nr:chloride channel protein [Achromobacter insolitus]MCP1403478.1 H+/Cl- antiporter ClcA [Achromobacter insolitus]OAD15844.1 chloride channel protein [Achromobacter insolitus]CAB3929222.1 Voltage-gated ClC-type chloride channel ClcB [Achromobacter insolitus]CAB3944264.1 Voltage-gated ClC-type chloride channel ClcB [Achromobacter insolitus]
MSSTSSSARAALRLGDFTTDKRVVLLMGLAIPVGLASVGAAWALLRLIALCTNLAYHHRFSFADTPIAASDLGLASVAIPVVGCLIIGLMARYGSEKIRGHGIPEAMEAILIGKSRIQPKVAVLKPVSSAVSIGTGGPFGAEGPIIMTGGAIGSLLAQTIHLDDGERKTLLVAGAAAGMTAIFATPLAAVLLAVELLLFEWKPRSFLPVAMAALVAAATRAFVLDAGPIFPYSGSLPFTPAHLLACAAVGVLAGLGSGVLTSMVYAAEDLFEKLPLHWMWWPAFGGLVIGIGGLIEPAALGVGYDNIRHLLAADLAFQGVLLLLVVKVIIWSVALGSGTSGGVLAPLLIFGGALGALATPLLPQADAGFWALLGMAAMMGGTMRAPLTATLFAVELTGDMGALLPVLAACVFAYGVTVLLLKRSILTEKIARRGHHVSREYRVDPFDLLRVSQVMTTPVQTLPADWTVAQAIAHFTTAQPVHTSYPVVDAQGAVVGEVTRADSLAWALDEDQSARTLGEALQGRELIFGHPEELASQLADRMALSGAGRVPILDRANGRLVGIVGRKDLFRSRARRLREESQRTAYFRRTPSPGG